MYQNSRFEEMVYMGSVFFAVKLYPDKAGPLREMEENKIFKYMH